MSDLPLDASLRELAFFATRVLPATLASPFSEGARLWRYRDALCLAVKGQFQWRFTRDPIQAAASARLKPGPNWNTQKPAYGVRPYTVT